MKSAIKSESMFGLLAEFKHTGDLLTAAKLVNKAGYKKWDTYSPFPVHGMDDAMGLKPSILGRIVFGHGLAGFALGASLTIWTSSMAYALNISGKPFANIPSFIPVIFELTILLSAFGAVFGMFYLNNMPKHHNKLFNSERFKRATDDGFFIVIESDDDLFNESKTADLLREAGAIHIEPISA